MGNNGGFNPYRDANGEFTDPGSSGKAGRSRAGAGGRAPSQQKRSGTGQAATTRSTPSVRAFTPGGLRAANIGPGTKIARAARAAVSGSTPVQKDGITYTRYHPAPGFTQKQAAAASLARNLEKVPGQYHFPDAKLDDSGTLVNDGGRRVLVPKK